LISSLSCFARINDYGFIESPYRKVKGGASLTTFTSSMPATANSKLAEIVERDRVEELNEELKRARWSTSHTASIYPHGKKTSMWSPRPTCSSTSD